MSAKRPPALVGEVNPYGGDAFFALYDEPATSTGGRLRRRIMRMPQREYRALPRYNLCHGEWKMSAARVEAALVRKQCEGHPIVLLGSKVCGAFGVPFVPFTRVAKLDYYILPHPSGLNRLWNEPGALDRAHAFIRESFPYLTFLEDS